MDEYQRLEILLPVILRCRLHLCLPTSKPRKALCLVALPCTLARHRRQELGFISRRISAITSASLRPNCNKIASKGVRSSQAISMMRSISCSVSAFKSMHSKQPCALFVAITWKALKNKIYHPKLAWLVVGPSPGAKNGRKTGKKSSIVQTAVGLSAINNEFLQLMEGGLDK